MRIYSRAPTRISLFGGGTDLPVFFEKHGGVVINLAINLYQDFWIFTPDEKFDESSYPLGGNPSFYKAFLGDNTYTHRFGGYIESGIGSSASAAVAMVAAMDKINNIKRSKQGLIKRAWQIENTLGLYGGLQDQCAAVHGGLNLFNFTNKGFSKESVPVGKLLDWLVLVYTGSNRTLPKIQEELRGLTHKQESALMEIKDITAKACLLLSLSKYEELGCFLDESWKKKKQANPKATTNHIDNIYCVAKKNGALGGKVCGSGGGGYMIFIVPPMKRQGMNRKLASLGVKEVNFSIDYNGVNTRIL